METQIKKNDLTSGIDFTLKNVAWFTRIADDSGWRALYNVVTDEVNPKKISSAPMAYFIKDYLPEEKKAVTFYVENLLL